MSRADGEINTYEVNELTPLPFEIAVMINDVMQWQADSDLVLYEICFPPYEDGRFQNF